MAEGKSVNLDIFAKDAFGNLYDLEMQNFCRSDEELDLRTRTYSTVAKNPQLAVGMKATKNSLQEINKYYMLYTNYIVLDLFYNC